MEQCQHCFSVLLDCVCGYVSWCPDCETCVNPQHAAQELRDDIDLDLGLLD